MTEKKKSGKQIGADHAQKFAQWWESNKANAQLFIELTNDDGNLNKSALGRIFGWDRKKFDNNANIAEKLSEIETELRSRKILPPEKSEEDCTDDKNDGVSNNSGNSSDSNIKGLSDQHKDEISRLRKKLSIAEKKIITLETELAQARGDFKRHRLVHSALVEMGVVIDAKP